MRMRGGRRAAWRWTPNWPSASRQALAICLRIVGGQGPGLSPHRVMSIWGPLLLGTASPGAGRVGERARNFSVLIDEDTHNGRHDARTA